MKSQKIKKKQEKYTKKPKSHSKRVVFCCFWAKIKNFFNFFQKKCQKSPFFISKKRIYYRQFFSFEKFPQFHNREKPKKIKRRRKMKKRKIASVVIESQTKNQEIGRQFYRYILEELEQIKGEENNDK